MAVAKAPAGGRPELYRAAEVDAIQRRADAVERQLRAELAAAMHKLATLTSRQVTP